MPSGQNNIDNKSYEELLIMQSIIDHNMQDSDEKYKNLTEDLIEIIAFMIYRIKLSKYSPNEKDPPKA